MSADLAVTLRRTSYRGVVVFHLTWQEGGESKDVTFDSEAEAVVEQAQIEQRLQLAAMAGKGLTVNPFGHATPYITSKDVHFASLRMQPRGLVFRDAIQDHVAAVAALQGLDMSVAEACRQFAQAKGALAAFDVSLEQAVFEWAELKKQIGDQAIFEVLRGYVKQRDGAGGADKPPSASA